MPNMFNPRIIVIRRGGTSRASAFIKRNKQLKLLITTFVRFEQQQSTVEQAQEYKTQHSTAGFECPLKPVGDRSGA